MWQKLWVKLIRFSGLSVEHSLTLTVSVSWWNSGTVRPHLEYGNVVWHSYLNKDMQLLEGVQQRATRMVPGLSKLYYKQRLKLMDLPSLFYRECETTSLKYTSTWMGFTKWTVQTYSHATELRDLQLVDIIWYGSGFYSHVFQASIWSLKNVTVKTGSVQICSDTGLSMCGTLCLRT